jgi:hypothetical protein
MAMRAETTAAVQATPMQADAAENSRRIAEEKRKHALRNRMLQEAESSAQQNADVAMHWADLFSIDVPQVHLVLCRVDEKASVVPDVIDKILDVDQCRCAGSMECHARTESRL